jgi:hypothetical protein
MPLVTGMRQTTTVGMHSAVRIVEATGTKAVAEFSRDELSAINNALNEVCHGPDGIEEGGHSIPA